MSIQINKGAALLIFVLIFLVVSTLFVYGVVHGVYNDLIQARILYNSKQAFFGTEAGIEDAVYRHRAGFEYASSESFVIGTVSVTANRELVDDTYTITVSSDKSNVERSGNIDLTIGSGASFGFGLQSGNGGITLANSSAVYGNVFSNGRVTGSGNDVFGDIISAGPTGLVDGINATGTVWANTITDSEIEVDAYYQTIDNDTYVSGVFCIPSNTHCYPGSSDQATRIMPIEDVIIEEWKLVAEAGGVVPLASCSGGTSAGTYTISSDQTLGPIKVPCNLQFSGNNTEVSLLGPVWVVGNISTSNGPTIQVDASLANKSIVVIADNPSNRTTSSKITIQGSSGFLGASGDSYVLMLSMNNSSENGGTETALDVDNNTPSSEREVIYYAPHGKLVGRNSLKIRGATAHQISLAQSASVYYETGMANPLFSGTGGGYVMASWKEVE